MPPKHKLIKRTRLVNNTAPTDAVSTNHAYVDPTPNSLQEKRRQHFKLTHQSSAPDALVDAAIAKEDYDRVRRSPQERATVGTNSYAGQDRDALRAARVIYTPEDIEQAKQLAEAHNAAIGNPLVPQVAPAISPEQAERDPAYVKDVIKQDALSMAGAVATPGIVKGINWLAPRIMPAATNTTRFVTRAITPSEYFNGLGYYLPRFSSQLQTIGKLANVGAAGYFTKQGIDDIVENGLTPTNAAETVLGVGGLGFELTPAIVRGYTAIRNAVRPTIAGIKMRTMPLSKVQPSKLVPKERFRHGDLEVNDPNLSYRYGTGIIKDFMDLGYVRTKNPEFSKPYFNQGEMFGREGRINLSTPKHRELLVTRETLQNSDEANGITNKYTGLVKKRVPYSKWQLNKSNVEPFVFQPGYGYKRYAEVIADENSFSLDGGPFLFRPKDFGQLNINRGIASPISSELGPELAQPGSEQFVFRHPKLKNKVLKVNYDFSGNLESFYNNYILPRNLVPEQAPITLEGITREGYPVVSQQFLKPYLANSFDSDVASKILKILRQNNFNATPSAVFDGTATSNGIIRIGDFQPSNVGFDTQGNLKFFDIDAEWIK